MKLLTPIPLLVCSFALFLSLFSCTKEIIKETIIQKDSIIIRRDSIIIRKDSIIIVEKVTDDLKKNKDLHYGVWAFYQHEIESYSGQVMTGKKVEVYNRYTVEWKRDGTYIQNRDGMIQTGTWDLISPSVFVYDKGDAVNERYYYINRLDSNYYFRKGPFNKNGGIHRDYLAVEYYKR